MTYIKLGSDSRKEKLSKSVNKKLLKFLGPSPILSLSKKLSAKLKRRKLPLNTDLQIRGGADKIKMLPDVDTDMCMSDEAFFESYNWDKPKPRRLTERELREIHSAKAGLSRDQKLVQSVLDDCIATSRIKQISEDQLLSVEKFYKLRRKHRRYLRFKRILPASITTPFTLCELTKMSYAAAIGSKSISLTAGGFIGYSFPAFFFSICHIIMFPMF